jgi:hypothetical protein
LSRNCDASTKGAWINISRQREKYHCEYNKVLQDKETEHKYLNVPFAEATTRAEEYSNL